MNGRRWNRRKALFRKFKCLERTSSSKCVDTGSAALEVASPSALPRQLLERGGRTENEIRHVSQGSPTNGTLPKRASQLVKSISAFLFSLTPSSVWMLVRMSVGIDSNPTDSSIQVHLHSIKPFLATETYIRWKF